MSQSLLIWSRRPLIESMFEAPHLPLEVRGGPVHSIQFFLQACHHTRVLPLHPPTNCLFWNCAIPSFADTENPARGEGDLRAR